MTHRVEIDDLIRSVETKLQRPICILMIDDEEDCYDLFARAVPGCRAVWALNGQRGLAILRADPTRFDAVVVDQKLPGISGLEVIAEIRAQWPDVFTILSSGFQFTDEQLKQIGGLGAVMVLPKPVQPTAVAQVLNFISERRG